MNTWVAFMRGINVGGKNRLPMKDLKAGLEEAGFQDVQTYIQSGNVVFKDKRKNRQALAGVMADTIEAGHGFRPGIVVLSAEDLAAAVEASPFGTGPALDKVLHLYFLSASPPAPDFERMDATKALSESYALRDGVFYLHTPDGFGKSKLAKRAERLLGVDATARNWRTVNAVLELAEG